MQGELRKTDEFRIYQIVGISWAERVLSGFGRSGREVQDLA